MTVDPRPLHAATRSARLWDQISAWGDQAAYLRATDILVVMTAAALPWSATATAVLVVLWVVLLIPIIDWDELVRSLAYPACALPLAFFALADLGVLWSGNPWDARLHGLNAVSKLLLTPLLLYHFQRSQRGWWVFIAFVGSCTLLMMLSWIVPFAPLLKIASTVSSGIPFKNCIDQSQEFALCAFGLTLPALLALRERRSLAFIGYLLLILTFVANMLFVASVRTALITMPVLAMVFAARYLGRRAILALFAIAAVGGMLVWATSLYLHKHVTAVAAEYQGYEADVLASTARRLNDWRKSIASIATAPLLGHGTASTERQFGRDLIGQADLPASAVSDPQNQTLSVAVQWGLVGVIVLYAMWLSHLLLFSGPGLAAWIGFAVVVQNILSSLLNSHLFDFNEGWMYVLGVGVAGGMSLQAAMRRKNDQQAQPERQ